LARLLAKAEELELLDDVAVLPSRSEPESEPGSSVTPSEADDDSSLSPEEVVVELSESEES